MKKEIIKQILLVYGRDNQIRLLQEKAGEMISFANKFMRFKDKSNIQKSFISKLVHLQFFIDIVLPEIATKEEIKEEEEKVIKYYQNETIERINKQVLEGNKESWLKQDTQIYSSKGSLLGKIFGARMEQSTQERKRVN